MRAVFQDSAGESHPVRIWFWLFLLSTAVAAERFPLRYAAAADIIRILSNSHSHLKFLQYPGGFVVDASAQELSEIRGELRRLDVPQVEERVAVEHCDRSEIVALLATLVDVSIELSGDYHLTLRGSRPEVAQALELLQQLDRPLEKLTVELRVVLDKPEMNQFLGASWAGRSSVDEQPVVKHWEYRPSASGSWIPGIGLAESPDFVKLAPWVLSSHRLQTRSGDEICITDHGVGWDITPNFKQDEYVVIKLLPELSDGLKKRRFTSDARLKVGETLVLGGLGRAEELDLLGEGPVLLMITVRQGW